MKLCLLWSGKFELYLFFVSLTSHLKQVQATRQETKEYARFLNQEHDMEREACFTTISRSCCYAWLNRPHECNEKLPYGSSSTDSVAAINQKNHINTPATGQSGRISLGMLFPRMGILLQNLFVAYYSYVKFFCSQIIIIISIIIIVVVIIILVIFFVFHLCSLKQSLVFYY